METKLTFWQTLRRWSGQAALLIVATGAADWLPGVYNVIVGNAGLQTALGNRWYGIVVSVLGIVCFVVRMLPQKSLQQPSPPVAPRDQP